VNPNSHGRLPVAVLGMNGFDVSQIDVSSLLLGCVAPIASQYEDVSTPLFDDACACTMDGPDGQMDLTLKFNMADIAAVLSGDTEQTLTLTGKLLDGTSIEGSDCIRLTPSVRGGRGGVEKPRVDANWGVVKRIYR